MDSIFLNKKINDKLQEDILESEQSMKGPRSPSP